MSDIERRRRMVRRVTGRRHAGREADEDRQRAGFIEMHSSQLNIGRPFWADCAPRGKARFLAQSAPTRRRSATTALRRFALFDYWRRMLRIGSRCCVGNLSTGCSWRSAPHKSCSGIPICSGVCVDRIGKQESSCARRRGVALPLQREPEGPDEVFRRALKRGAETPEMNSNNPRPSLRGPPDLIRGDEAIHAAAAPCGMDCFAFGSQ